MDKDIRYCALFTEKRSILYDIIDTNDLQSLTTDLVNILKEQEYKVEVVDNEWTYNSIQISW